LAIDPLTEPSIH